MNPEEILIFVQSQLERGESREKIESILKVNQVTPEQIAAAFAQVLPGSAPSGTPTMPKPTPTPPPIAQTPPSSFTPPTPSVPPPPPPPPRPIPTPTPTFTPPAASYSGPAMTASSSGSHLGMVLTIILILILLVVGGFVYAYKFQPELLYKLPLIGELLQPVATDNLEVTLPPVVIPETPAIITATSTETVVTSTTTTSTSTETVTATSTVTTTTTETTLTKLQAIQALAPDYQTTKQSYLGLCEDTGVTAILAQLSNSAVVCHVGTIGKSYGITAKETDGSYVCVDSTGFAGPATGSLPAGVTACSAVK